MTQTEQIAKIHAQTASIERAEIRKTTGDLSDSADRRTELAADRTLYAAERTYAAWVRTGLAALASGVGAKALLTGVLPGLGVRGAGAILTLFSAFCFGAAVWREAFGAVPPPIPNVRRIPRAVLYAMNGMLAVVALVALVSVAFG